MKPRLDNRKKGLDDLRVMRAATMALSCMSSDGWDQMQTESYLRAIGFTPTERLHGLQHAMRMLCRMRKAN